MVLNRGCQNLRRVPPLTLEIGPNSIPREQQGVLLCGRAERGWSEWLRKRSELPSATLSGFGEGAS